MCDLLIVGFCKCMIIAFGLKEVGVVSEDICVVAALDGFLIVEISHMMISADGTKLEVIGSHAREPFFARDPVDGRIAMSDQQGNWVPSSGSFPVTPGSGFGYGGKEEGG